MIEEVIENQSEDVIFKLMKSLLGDLGEVLPSC